MALKDLKSNLSDFRKPKSEPLTKKERPKPTSFSTTPLSDKIQDKKVQSPKQTPEKVGTTPSEVKQGDKFKGETSPTVVNQTEKFKGETDTKPMSLEERFLGQTDPTLVNQTEKFKGETTPTEANQTEKFKGETTPTEANQSEKFKGETTPTEVNQSEKFKGETTPSDFKFTQQFLGETTPSDFKFVQQFLGETTPNLSDRSSKFLGETEPVESDRSSKFLGETTPNPSDRSSKFLGETTPVESDRSSKFLGETTPKNFTFSGQLENQGLEVGQKVNFFTDDKALGFSPFMTGVDDTKFVGIDPQNTKFDGASSLIGNINDTQYPVRLDNDSGLGKFYTDKILKETYNKFNLKEDAFNRSTIKQPFDLRGIQRKKGEPQVSGIGSTSLIRGGAETSVERGLTDAARLSQFLLTPRGIIWAVKQVGLQKSQKFATEWKPDNLLATVAGSGTGLHPERGGNSLINKLSHYVTTGEELTDSKFVSFKSKNGLRALYDTVEKKWDGANPELKLQEYNGGFGSVYGLGLTSITRVMNTRVKGTVWGEFTQKGTTKTYTLQKFNPFKNKNSDIAFEETYGKSVPPAKSTDERNKFGLAPQALKEENTKKLDENLTLSSEGFKTGTQPDIADYSRISMGIMSKISKDRHKSPTKLTDFRQEQDVKPDKTWGDNNDEKIETKFGFPDSGQLRQKDNKTRSQKNQWGDGVEAWQAADPIQSLDIGSVDTDLVNMIFQQGTEGSRIQFRGTISGLAENFSPTYTEIKYSGRAEPVYVYDTFKRDISFNFKVYPTSRAEMKPIWKKLERLSTYTMPDYLDNGYTAPGEDGNRELLLTIGYLYQQTPMILTALSYTYSDDTPWDIDYGLPMGIDIQVSCTILGNELHKYDSEKVFSFSTDIRS